MKNFKRLALKTVDFLAGKNLYDDEIVIYIGDRQNITASQLENSQPVQTPKGQTVYLNNLSKSKYINNDLMVEFGPTLRKAFDESFKIESGLNTLFRLYGLYCDIRSDHALAAGPLFDHLF